MDPKDLTLEVLKDIREELRETRTEMKIEINGLKEEIRQTTFGSRISAFAECTLRTSF